jgi:hypothetical protein
VRISYFSRSDELGLVDRALVEYQTIETTIRGSESLPCQFCEDIYDSMSWYCPSCGRFPSWNDSNYSNASTLSLSQQVEACHLNQERRGLVVDEGSSLSHIDRRVQSRGGRRGPLSKTGVPAREVNGVRPSDKGDNEFYRATG